MAGPWTIGKTFEVIKNQGAYAEGKKMSMASFRRMFLGLCADWQRTQYGLPPMPKAIMPEPATLPAEEGKSQEYIQAEQWIQAWRAKSSKTVQKVAQEEPQDSMLGNGYAPNVQEAANWIAAWKSKASV
eukprot:TRINITY_DN12548_c0_g1_i1.p1 TRINITY_DN12548_c0_g1~~TRINITY_DN12548_c0_g1_i1.p1  ORF type:complete len:129 (+),score=24.60 TRINITY_DN12548_c0_g1_i1:205-591(+)